MKRSLDVNEQPYLMSRELVSPFYSRLFGELAVRRAHVQVRELGRHSKGWWQEWQKRRRAVASGR